MNRVLVIDDDREFCRFLRDHLVREEMTVHFAHDGRSGLASALSGQFDVVALEVTLPGVTGPQVIKQLRANCGVGVMVLTDRGDEMDGIIGLEYGADDYLTKPVNPREFVARIRAISRRLKCLLASEFAPAPEYLEIGDLALDEGTRTCCCNGEVIELTTVEFDLLSALLRRNGRVIHRKELLKQVFDREYSPFDRTIDVHVSNLRRKLGTLSNGTERIRGVRNIGYSYVVPVAPRSLAG